jgi:hypothetical protein
MVTLGGISDVGISISDLFFDLQLLKYKITLNETHLQGTVSISAIRKY